MSDLFNNFSSILELNIWVIPLFSFVFSLLGSIHCAGMCGGLAITIGTDRQSVFFYQFGKLISYTILGILAGLLGKVFMLKNLPLQYQIVPIVIFTLYLFFLSYKIYRKQRLEIPLPVFIDNATQSLQVKVLKIGYHLSLRPLLMGLLNFLLPCGYLYGVLILLTGTESGLTGGLSMFGFALGTMPATILAPFAFKKLKNQFPQHSSLILSFIILSIGLITVFLKVNTLLNAPACH